MQEKSNLILLAEWLRSEIPRFVKEKIAEIELKEGPRGPSGFDGQDGKDGQDGTGVEAAEIRRDGHLWITLTDGREIDAGQARGASGVVYRKGKDGQQTAIVPGETSAIIAITAGETLNAFRVVRADALGRAVYASAASIDGVAAIIGITATAALSGAEAQVVTGGDVTNAGWNFTAGQPVYLGINGEITAAQVGAVSLYIGYALTATSIFVRIGRPIIRG